MIFFFLTYRYFERTKIRLDIKLLAGLLSGQFDKLTVNQRNECS